MFSAHLLARAIRVPEDLRGPDRFNYWRCPDSQPFMDINDGRTLAQNGTCVTKRWTPADLRATEVPARKAKGGRVSLRRSSESESV
jgi:hypothetical protein